MTVEEIRRHIRYSTWASHKLLDAASKLDSEQMHRDFGMSHKSVHGTLEHILFGDRVWLSRLLNEKIEPEGAVEAELPRIRARWEALADTWTDDDVMRTVSFTRPNGDAFTAPVRDIVLHVVNHATLHRGQVMSLLRQLGVTPPSTDIFAYLREVRAARA